MRTAITLLFLWLWTLVANAGQVSSATSSINVSEARKCREIEPETEISAGTWLCEGFEGINIYVKELDLRNLIAYGKNPVGHCSAHQTFNKFNEVDPTIEWRIENGKVFAAIERWGVSDGGSPEKFSPWLVVTKIEPANSCKVALIDGSLPHAKEKARDAADRLASKFKCQTGTATIVSNSPIKIEDLFSGTPCGTGDY